LEAQLEPLVRQQVAASAESQRLEALLACPRTVAAQDLRWALSLSPLGVWPKLQLEQRAQQARATQ
jgi:hypothetical protein